MEQHLGRAEIFYNGEWGTICHDYWDNPETNVFCRQLGFEGAITGLRSAAFGEGSGMIWMDDINCTGQETAISQCVHKGWRVTDCKHSQDAGVICIPKGEMILKDIMEHDYCDLNGYCKNAYTLCSVVNG